MTISRREFLKASISAGCIGAFSGVSSLSYAANADTFPLLIVLFLRGGADGLSLIAPSADSEYIAARPSDLRVLDEGDGKNVVDNSIDRNAGFRFNPNAAAFPDLYRSKRMGIVHAVGILDATRSHFVAQEIIEKGVNEEQKLSRTEDGWLARAIRSNNNTLAGYSAAASTDISLYGVNSVFSAPDVTTNFDFPGGQSTGNFLNEICQDAKSPIQLATANTLNLLDVLYRRQPRNANGQASPQSSITQIQYDGSGELGRSLSSIARLSSMDVGLKVATLDHGGWDTHEGQAYRLPNQMRQLSIGLAAFDEEMQYKDKRYNLIVMTEFGRRLQSNKSGGTDHGHGACWLVLGDSVRGGKMYGQWPGLKNEALDHGVDLAVTTDYRNVLQESLIASGLNPAKSFSDLRESSSLHLFS